MKEDASMENQKEQMKGEILCILNRNNTEEFIRHILTVALVHEKVLVGKGVQQ